MEELYGVASDLEPLALRLVLDEGYGDRVANVLMGWHLHGTFHNLDDLLVQSSNVLLIYIEIYMLKSDNVYG